MQGLFFRAEDKAQEVGGSIFFRLMKCTGFDKGELMVVSLINNVRKGLGQSTFVVNILTGEKERLYNCAATMPDDYCYWKFGYHQMCRLEILKNSKK